MFYAVTSICLTPLRSILLNEPNCAQSDIGGNHSDGGVAKLKPALKRHIEKHSKMFHNHVEGNEGMIRVEWIL